ncbi:MAG TPA: hypothetical protein PKL77_10420 [Candidatus Omnitrophota bacterium]|nr:hypothetical protein [Candidatus Omnitrophota bacterium]HPT08007.1 hypothetical protein [Candidatus Omnitrophota bacterium]
MNITDPETILETIEYRIARTRQETEEAYSLVYREYLERGYVKHTTSHMRYSIFNALPQTTTFIGKLEDTLISTVTIIPDTSIGLPMDNLYSQELAALRQKNYRICEIAMLATDNELFSEGISMMTNSTKMLVVFNLFKLLFDYASVKLNMDYMCITINPKHKLTYDFLLFSEIGGIKTYDSVNGAPAIAMCLDLKNIKNECEQKKRPVIAQIFLGKPTDPDKLNNKFIMAADDLRYFFVEKSDIFKQASSQQMAQLKLFYPHIDFSTITS